MRERCRVARDYYGLLGVATDAGRTRSSGRTASWRGSCIPTSTRTRRRSSGSRRSPRPTRCSPTRRSGRSSTSAATRSAAAVAAAAPAAWATRSARWASATSWTPSSAAAAAAARSRGPRTRVRPGDDALIPIELTLEECATGVAKDLAVDTATLCSVCHGSGCAPGTRPATCDICKGRGEVQQSPALAARPGRHLPAVPGLPRLRRGHPRPVPAVQRRGPGARPAHRAGATSRPASATASGSGWPARARSAPAAAPPATCTSRSRSCRTSVSPATASTCTAPCRCR